MEFDRSFIVSRKAVDRDDLRQTGAKVLAVVSFSLYPTRTDGHWK